jgi:hypothetical protein
MNHGSRSNPRVIRSLRLYLETNGTGGGSLTMHSSRPRIGLFAQTSFRAAAA